MKDAQMPEDATDGRCTKGSKIDARECSRSIDATVYR